MELYLQCVCATLVLLFLAFGVPKIVNGLADSLAKRRTTTVTTFELPQIIVPLEMPEVKTPRKVEIVLHKITVTQEEMRRMIDDSLTEKEIFNADFSVRAIKEIFSGEAKGSFEIEVEVND